MVNIIQHPGGSYKKVALRNNAVYSAEHPRLHYLADTLSGSSGSPVLDDSWSVIALHRAAITKSVQFQGRELQYVNEGIQMHAILAALEDQAATSPQVREALDQIYSDQTQVTPATV